MAEIQDLVRDFENFLDTTEESRQDLARDRGYTDHKQWTAEESEALRERGQAPIVINRIKTKVNLLSGIERQRRTDPKALPRTPRHEEGADAVTDALRYVADNTDFEQVASECFEDLLHSTESAIVEVDEVNGEFEIQINRIEDDRFYYDPHSRARDFSDAKFMGIVIWMDQDDAETMFPEKKDEIEAAITGNTDSVDGTTFDDKPTWIDKKRKRLRVCQHYFKEKGKWQNAYFTQNLFLIEQWDSPYRDEFGEPSNPIEAQSLYVDRDNNRYGEVRSYIWIQDEINHRRSKLLYMLSVRQTMAEKGAVNDVSEMKRQLSRPDGHVEVNRNFEFQLLDTNDMSQGQFSLYQESKAEIDSVGANAALSGTSEQDLSGRAVQALQQGGMAEVGQIYDSHNAWKRRVYRQVWARVKQYWDAERWIRVTDNEDNLKWVGLNMPVTGRELLEEQVQQDPNNEIAGRLLQEDDPRLNEVAEVRNNVVELDMDITLTDSPDYATLRQEQFDTMVRLAEAYGPDNVPFELILELSDMSRKSEVKELLSNEVDPEQQQAQAELAAMNAKLDMNLKDANIKAKKSKAAKDMAEAEAQLIENQAVRGQLGSVG